MCTPKERTFGKSVHAKRTRERERGGEEDGRRRGDGARGAIPSSAIPSRCRRRLGVMETVEKAVVASGLPFFHQYLPICKLRAVRQPFDSDEIEQVSAKSSVGGEKQNPSLVSVGFGIVSLFSICFFGKFCGRWTHVYGKLVGIFVGRGRRRRSSRGYGTRLVLFVCHTPFLLLQVAPPLTA